MSWDEQDWSNTYIIGKTERFGKSKISNDICNGEVEHRIRLKGYHVPDLGFSFQLDKIACLFGVMIQYQYLGGTYYRYDYRKNEPELSKDEISQRDLIKEVYDIVSYEE